MTKTEKTQAQKEKYRKLAAKTYHEALDLQKKANNLPWPPLPPITAGAKAQEAWKKKMNALYRKEEAMNKRVRYLLDVKYWEYYEKAR